LLIRELDLKVPIADPMKCIVKIANKANLSEKTIRHAANIMTEVISKEITTGKHPMSLAGSAALEETFEDSTAEVLGTSNS